MTNDGSTDQTKVRNTLRLIGALLFAIGAGGIVIGAVVFARGFLADDIDSMVRDALIGVLVFGVSGVVAVAGVSALSAGFRRDRGRYVPTESMPPGTGSIAFLSEADDRPVE